VASSTCDFAQAELASRHNFMTAEAIEMTGILRSGSGTFRIDLDQVPEGFAAEQPVRLVLWDARPTNQLPLIEQIAEAQQLDRQFVAQGLTRQGAFVDLADEVDPTLLYLHSSAG
jgi:hypothetical protein